jgi:cobalt/nickel transport system permease protein
MHRLDPRAKLLAAAALSLAVGLSGSPVVWWGGLVGGLSVVGLARLPLGPLARRLVAVNAFVALLWVVLPWRVQVAGPDWLAYHPQGLALAGAITVKTNAIVLALLGLLATSPANALFHALAHLRAPSKLVHLFLFFYRYLHVLHREYHRLTLAMRARGFRPGNNLHTYRSYGQLAGMVLVKSFDRAERVYQAMLCRGFSGTLWLLDHFAWGRRETAFCAAAGAYLAGLLCAGHGGWA